MGVGRAFPLIDFRLMAGAASRRDIAGMVTPITSSPTLPSTSGTQVQAVASPEDIQRFQAAMAAGPVTDAQVEKAITDGIVRQIILDTQKHLDRIKETWRS